ncbi:hypothetical protein AKJ37_03325 [candidate division MSBL1 archaeon SCGC-AAA259I09]|uniref:Uncharacterized protein n=1 Tax=candidate division MSBL1 archaeon SCGC-AAA259I09 TaxID=1698267 RepID=A0A133USY8_9EURY|nr:hypothetical protein AKJ37_03325 [candidate division MSBL1 archaeon SCGC-AAA259I09]
MSKFVGECPVDGCDFRKESYWKNVAKGGVILHIYQTEGEGHGSRDSHPEKDFEIVVRDVKDE